MSFYITGSGAAYPVSTTTRPGLAFIASKRSLDIVVSLVLIPLFLMIVGLLFLLNPLMNRGPVFYCQIRMGRACKPFIAYKFRSMTRCGGHIRKPFDPVESARVTPLGRVLRRSRLDELPQIINVLKGDMSLIGPRPDYVHHARYYLRHIHGYRARYQVRPGISGYAQTEVGYAQNQQDILAKVRADNYYVNNPTIGFELWIFWRTIQAIVRCKGT